MLNGSSFINILTAVLLILLTILRLVMLPPPQIAIPYIITE